MLVGLLFIILSVSVGQPNALALVGQIMLILAIALSIFVRANRTRHHSLSRHGDGTHALVSGQATRQLRKRLLELAAKAAEDTPTSASPSTI